MRNLRAITILALSFISINSQGQSPYLTPEAQNQVLKTVENEMNKLKPDTGDIKGYYTCFSRLIYGCFFLYKDSNFEVYSYYIDKSGNLNQQKVPSDVVFSSNAELYFSLRNFFFDNLNPKTLCSDYSTDIHRNDDRYFYFFKGVDQIEAVHYSISCVYKQKEFFSTFTNSLLETFAKRSIY